MSYWGSPRADRGLAGEIISLEWLGSVSVPPDELEEVAGVREVCSFERLLSHRNLNPDSRTDATFVKLSRFLFFFLCKNSKKINCS